MSVSVKIETAKQELDVLLDHLPFGETITLTGSNGQPQALIVKLQQAGVPGQPAQTSTAAESVSEWFAQWDDLAKQVDAAWTSPKSIVDTLIEMRR